MYVQVIYFSLLALMMASVVLRPARAVAAVLLLFGLKQWAMAKSAWFVHYRTLPNYSAAALLALGLVVIILRRGFKLGRYPAAGWLTVCLFALAAGSYLWTVDRPAFISQWVAWAPYVITVILLTPLLIVDTRDLHDALLATLLFGVPIMLLLFYDVTVSGRFVSFAGVFFVGSERSFGGNPLAIAQMSGHIMLISMLLRFTGISRFWQIVRWGVVALALSLILRSGSRGQFAAAVVAGTMFLPFSRQIRNIKGFIALVVGFTILACLGAWLYTTFAVQGRWTWEMMVHDWQYGRVATSLRVLSYWTAHPGTWLFGLGNSSSFLPTINGCFCEVQPIDILVEEGLVGCGLWLAIIGVTIVAFWRMCRSPLLKVDSEIRGLMAAVGAMFVFELILGFKQGSLLAGPHVFAFAIILGRFYHAMRTREQEEDLAVSPPGYVWADEAAEVGQFDDGLPVATGYELQGAGYEVDPQW